MKNPTRGNPSYRNLLSAVPRLCALGVLLAAVACQPISSERFAYSVAHGDVASARKFYTAGDVNMRIYKSPKHYALPIQYAILQGNRPMADYLLERGAKTELDGENLAFYSAARGHHDMARHFVKRGIGSSSDINRGKDYYYAQMERERQRMRTGGLAALWFVGLLMASSGGGGGGERTCEMCGGAGAGPDGMHQQCKGVYIYGN